LSQKLVTLGAALVAALAAAAPAVAQPGNLAEHSCMMGAPLPQGEVDSTRVYTSTSMATYSQALGRAGQANVQRAWQSGDRRATWRSGRIELGYSGLTNVIDPFVSAGARIDPAPRDYVRSGDGELVEGLWTAHDSAGTLVGVYDATFTRVEGVWRLHSLTLLRPSEAPAELAQFCHRPGDVAAYKAAYEQRQLSTRRGDGEAGGGGR
jgi:hypothetical protein